MNDGQATGRAERISDRQLEVVMQIARMATEDVELQPMLTRIVDAVREAFGWQFVAFASIDDVNGRFICEAVSGKMPSLIHVGYSRELGSGVVGQVAATGKAILLDDVRNSPNYVETATSVRSELCVPVVHRGQVLGVINAESVHIGTFRGQLPLLETVASHVAGAIAGARLHRELARRAAVLELMSEVAHTALETSQLAEVAQRIASYVQRRFA
ncbi:MAG: GAF domain-containing protein, partial [Lysobacterales bacterium]